MEDMLGRFRTTNRSTTGHRIPLGTWIHPNGRAGETAGLDRRGSSTTLVVFDVEGRPSPGIYA